MHTRYIVHTQYVLARGSAIRTLRLLNLRWIRRQPLRTAIAVLSVTAGVALVAAVSIVQTSIDRSFREFGRSLSGPAPLRVVGPTSRGGLAEDTLQRVERVPGVRAAIPVVQAVTFATTGGRDIPIVALGFDCRVEALIGRVGCTPQLLASASVDAPPLISKRLLDELGPRGVIRTDLGARPVRGAFAVEQLNRVNAGNVVAYPLRVAQALYARPNNLDAIYIVPTKGADLGALRARLANAAGAHNGVLRSTDSPPSFTFVGMLVLLLGVIGLFALGIGAVLVRNAIALSLSERRRDLAIAAAVGATPSSLLGAALFEAGLLGVIGGLGGAGIGFVAAQPMVAGMNSLAGRVSGLHLQVHYTWTPLILAAVVGCVVAVISSWRPARDASRIEAAAELYNRPRESSALRPHKLRRSLPLLGVAAAGLVFVTVIHASGGLEPWQPIAGQVVFFVSTIALFVACGQLAPWIFQSTRGLMRRSGAAGRLGWANLVREPRRSAVMVIAATAAVALGLSIASITAEISEGIAIDVQRSVGGRLRVSTMPSSNTLSLDGRPSPKAIEALRRLPGVASVTGQIGMGIGTTSEDFKGVEATDDDFFTYKVIRGTFDLERFRRGEVLVGVGLARNEGLRPGSTFRIPTRTGFADLKVQGIWQNGDYSGREITMPMAMLERFYGKQPPVNLRVEAARGVSAEELKRRILAARIDPFFIVQTPDEQFADASREARVFVQPFWALQRGMMFVAFAAVLFTLLLVAVQRRRELGLVAAVGMDPAGLARTVLSEALAVGVVSTVLGAVAGLVFAEFFRQVAFLIVPFDFPFRVDVFALVKYAALTTGLLLLAAAWPAWRTSRLEVVDAIRYE